MYNRVSDGQGIITVHNYKTDGEQNEWTINALPQAQSSVIVKLENVVLDPAVYTVDYKSSTLTLTDSSLLDANKNLNIVI